MNVSTDEATSRPQRVLVVEDHRALAGLLRHVLAHAGIAAEVISNGAEAILRLKEDAGDYELVSSDMELLGASGWTILEWVRICHPELPMVLVSGTNDGNYPAEAGRRGATAAFRKPFSVAAIQQTLAQIFPYL